MPSIISAVRLSFPSFWIFWQLIDNTHTTSEMQPIQNNRRGFIGSIIPWPRSIYSHWPNYDLEYVTVCPWLLRPIPIVLLLMVQIRSHAQYDLCGQYNSMHWWRLFEVFLNKTNLKLTSKYFKKCQQKIKLPSVGTELTALTITGLEVWCSSNCTNLSCLASLRLLDSYKVMLYWI